MRSHFADELTAEGVDDTSNGGGATLADEVEVEHTLHGTGLHTTVFWSMECAILNDERGNSLDEASCLVVEQGVLGDRAEEARRRVEAGDVVVGACHAGSRSDGRHLG
jgi:hypothetical protein